MKMKPLLLIAALVLVGFSACKKGEKKSASGKANSTAKARPKPKPVTPQERASATAFGEKIDETLKAGDTDYVLRAFDFGRIILDGFEGIDLPRTFSRDMREGLNQAKGQIKTNLENTRVDFLEFREVRGMPGLLFRFRSGDALEYMEYQLAASKQHESGWQITDAYTHSMGTFVTDLMRALMLPAMAQKNRSLVDKIFNGNKNGDYMKELPKLSQVMQLARTGDPANAKRALELWNTIPESAKNTRYAKFIKIIVHGNFIEELEVNSPYFKAINEFEKEFPNDPALSLMSIDSSLMRKDFEGAREALRSLKKSINDPYIDFYAGYVEFHAEQYDTAEKLARNFIESDPQDRDGYALLLEVGFVQDKHEMTAQALTSLEGDFEMDFSAVFSIPEWKNFVESEVGKQWAADRR